MRVSCRTTIWTHWTLTNRPMARLFSFKTTNHQCLDGWMGLLHVWLAWFVAPWSPDDQDDKSELSMTRPTIALDILILVILSCWAHTHMYSMCGTLWHDIWLVTCDMWCLNEPLMRSLWGTIWTSLGDGTVNKLYNVNISIQPRYCPTRGRRHTHTWVNVPFLFVRE